MRACLLIVLLAAVAAPMAAQSEEEEVMVVIHRLFDGMRAGDSAMVRSTFHPSMTTASIFTNRQGDPEIHSGRPDEFVKAVGTPAFYLGGDLSHCGVNAFQLFNGKEGWRIIRIADTHRRKGCGEDSD